MTPADLQRIRASQGWRSRRVELFHGTSQGSVFVKGQRAPRSVWRYRLLSGFAGIAGVPLLRAVPAHGGAQAQRIEVSRLRELAAAGVAVPQVLHVEDEFFAMSCVEGLTLPTLLRQQNAVLWWQRGLQCLVALHARGQYLSQAFARNFIAVGERLVMIDFEDDPLEAMPLEQAQARDWLAYLHSSARLLQACPPEQRAEAIDMLRAELAREHAAVRQLVATTAHRLGWLQRIPAGDGAAWRRHVAIAQSAVALMRVADAARPNEIQDHEVIHARHH